MLLKKIVNGIVLTGKTIRGDVVKKVFIATNLTVVFVILLIFTGSLIMHDGGNSSWLIDNFGINFFQAEYYRVLGVIWGFGIISSIGITIFIALPFGQKLRDQCNKISDANAALSRGNFNYIMQEEGYAEYKDISVWFNRMAKQTKSQVESLQRLVTENKTLLEDAEQAATIQERRKLARELHDSISQQLFAINATVSAIPLIIEKDPQKAKEYFKNVEKMVNSAQQELRALILHLRPVNLEGSNLENGVLNFLDEISMKHPEIKIHKEIKDIIGAEAGVENNLFRVTQEAISNILRHAKASSFSVKLYTRKNLINLIIEDNGVGISEENQSKKTSYGMTTMKERVEEIGGVFDVKSFPGKGTRIEIRVPRTGDGSVSG